MLRNRRHSRRIEEEPELDLVPIMNMFLVLIPFLLISASFFHLRAINTSVPVLGNAGDSAQQERDIKLTVVVELEEKGMRLSALCDQADPEDLKEFDSYIPKEINAAYPLEELASSLRRVKSRFPSSDTLIIIPEESVIYETIIQAMDAARNSDDTRLFPNVVISGKVA